MDNMECYLFILTIFFKLHYTKADHLHLQGNVHGNISCTGGEKIHITYASFNSYYSRCPDTKYKCKNEIQQLKDQCNGKPRCNIATKKYFSCQRKPRHVILSYQCMYTRVYRYLHQASMCGTYGTITCSNGYMIYSIESVEFEYIYSSESQYGIRKCLNDVFNRHCFLEYNHCPILKWDWCLYLPFSVNVEYNCIKDDKLYSKNNLSTRATFPPRMTPRIVRENVSSSDTYDTSLGLEGRIIVTNRLKQEQFTVCANNWTDNLASIICNYLNISATGKEGVVKRGSTFKRVSYGFSCKEIETNPFECRPFFIYDSRVPCGHIGDATVTCLDNNTSDTTGTIIGVAIGVVVILILVFFIIACVWRKRQKGRRKQHLDTRGIRSKSDSFGNNVSEPLEMLRGTHEPNQNYFILEQRTEDENESQYMSTTEGVYDVSNDGRHKNADEANVYDHSISDVYDVASRDRQDRVDDTSIYNQVNNEGIYDTSGNKPKHRTGAYDLYSKTNYDKNDYGSVENK